MYTEKDVNKGLKAEELLNNDVLNSAFEEIKRDYFEKFSRLKPSDSVELSELNRQCRLLNELKEKLEQFASTGRIAKTKLEKLKNKVGLK